MVTHDQIKSMVDGFSEPVDAAAFVTEWGQMAYVVRCMVSDLARADAVEVVNQLVVAPPVGMLPLGGEGGERWSTVSSASSVRTLRSR